MVVPEHAALPAGAKARCCSRASHEDMPRSAAATATTHTDKSRSATTAGREHGLCGALASAARPHLLPAMAVPVTTAATGGVGGGPCTLPPSVPRWRAPALCCARMGRPAAADRAPDRRGRPPQSQVMDPDAAGFDETAWLAELKARGM